MQRNRYVINQKTLAIIPKRNRYGEAYSEIYEDERIVYVAQSALSIIVANLDKNKQTLRRACEGTKRLLGNIKLPPITLNMASGLYWFCTDEPYKNTGAWYAVRGIRKTIKVPDGTTIVILSNGQPLHESTDFNIFEDILKNASLLKRRREQHMIILLRYGGFSAEKGDRYEGEE